MLNNILIIVQLFSVLTRGLLSAGTWILDLVPREAAEKWLKYLREELPTVAFKCSTQEQKSNLGWKSAKAAKKTNNLLQTSDCLGAETLLKLLKNYSRSHEVSFNNISMFLFGLSYLGESM